ncbi:Chaperone DnaK-like protein [Cladobotryum mycophilum]|uniref:Chaperone DnaK-like protein n=1 Tax=Cladobotryum mycophilum TaxID=491253 RepID=A0ABR0SRB3_9HYPO
MASRRLIVGVDYGTTRSSLSFVLTGENDMNKLLIYQGYKTVGSYHGPQPGRVPTMIAYTEKNSELAVNAWGYLIKPGTNAYSWTKLLLDQTATSSEFDDPNLQSFRRNGMMQLPAGKSADDVVVDFLRELYKEYLKAAKIFLQTSDWATQTEVVFWLSVPASWKYQAITRFREAASQAGFSKFTAKQVSFVPEPEAAAHSALIDQPEGDFKKGTRFIICDCGGGTVDTISYEIVNTESKFELEVLTTPKCEFSPPHSTFHLATLIDTTEAGTCGGTFVDRNLFILLSQRFGHHFDSLGGDIVGPGSRFMSKFEDTKAKFGIPNALEWPTKLPLEMDTLDPDHYDNWTATVLLSHQDFENMFDPAIEKIISMLDDQLRQVKGQGKSRVENLILVGGFGSSPYLQERLSQWCKRDDIQLSTPDIHGSTAVVRGAAMRGLGSQFVQIRGRKYPRHYGHSLSKRFNAKQYHGYDKNKRVVWNDRINKRRKIDGCMEWQIRKGDSIESGMQTPWQIHQTYEGEIPELETRVIYACSLEEAPDSIEGEGIEEVGRITYSPQQVPKDDIICQPKENPRYFDVTFFIDYHFDEECGDLIFRVLSRQMELGRTKIDLTS